MSDNLNTLFFSITSLDESYIAGKRWKILNDIISTYCVSINNNNTNNKMEELIELGGIDLLVNIINYNNDTFIDDIYPSNKAFRPKFIEDINNIPSAISNNIDNLLLPAKPCLDICSIISFRYAALFYLSIFTNYVNLHEYLYKLDIFNALTRISINKKNLLCRSLVDISRLSDELLLIDFAMMDRILCILINIARSSAPSIVNTSIACFGQTLINIAPKVLEPTICNSIIRYFIHAVPKANSSNLLRLRQLNALEALRSLESQAVLDLNIAQGLLGIMGKLEKKVRPSTASNMNHASISEDFGGRCEVSRNDSRDNNSNRKTDWPFEKPNQEYYSKNESYIKASTSTTLSTSSSFNKKNRLLSAQASPSLNEPSNSIPNSNYSFSNTSNSNHMYNRNPIRLKSAYHINASPRLEEVETPRVTLSHNASRESVFGLIPQRAKTPASPSVVVNRNNSKDFLLKNFSLNRPSSAANLTNRSSGSNISSNFRSKPGMSRLNDRIEEVDDEDEFFESSYKPNLIQNSFKQNSKKLNRSYKESPVFDTYDDLGILIDDDNKHLRNIDDDF